MQRCKQHFVATARYFPIMRKILYYSLLFITLCGCHQYEDPGPGENKLPNELAVEAEQVWFDANLGVYNRIQIVFEYQGDKYRLDWRSENYRYNEYANSTCLIAIESEYVITTPPEEFTSELWSRESESSLWSSEIEPSEDAYDWGNAFNAFEPFSLVFMPIEPINPGFRAAREGMQGIQFLTISINPANATIIYSQFNFNYSSKVYAQYYLGDPEIMIETVHLMLEDMLESYCDVSIEKIRE